MKLFIDSAELADIERYDADPYISGFTTNATLVKNAGSDVDKLIAATSKDISVEAGSSLHFNVGHVRWKVTAAPASWTYPPGARWNITAICAPSQIPAEVHDPAQTILSVFCGRIMDTGRDPRDIIQMALRTRAQVLWASSRCVYDITLAELYGCDIITVTPAIYEKYRAWHGKPLEVVAEETIAQFRRDAA